ncbi:hypothetical protein A3E73_01485 [Candidatus Beckwithbacteria bacterium RIFCSPHIGHO2_12_FULL_47_17]|uniref:Uncharacterized protein n=1 Tax=Candidatus Beckwithbacteria bacterium RIFCSPHIGHO2_12_FULL_47_17 TaxID=1797460 RepID=A0A1F5DK74_9BACT|nr:MAG: hypothetical protein A3E73_01485 [Candidatus Beckwithbacteria bacterium RIFCSPHIGHO2_12_FULL_47_17]
MVSRKEFAAKVHQAVVKRVGQNSPGNTIQVDRFPRPAENFILAQKPLNIHISIAAGSKQPEGFCNKLGADRINDNGFIRFVIYVTQRGFIGPVAAPQFLPIPPFDVFTQIIHVILGFGKSHGDHKFSLRCVVKPKGREFQV